MALGYAEGPTAGEHKSLSPTRRASGAATSFLTAQGRERAPGGKDTETRCTR